jgi:predicted amidohydrolase
VRAQRAADLVVLPELWLPGAFAFDSFAGSAEPLDGPTVAALGAAARAAGVWLHGGSLVERAEDGSLFNTSVLFAPDGALAASYRKIHLFGFAGGETTVLRAGTEPVLASIDGLTVGLATCYDLRFPELFRLLQRAGAEAFLVPATWPDRRVAHWSLLARARAVENQAYLVACNAVGVQGSVTLGGATVIVDPWGVVLAEGAMGEESLHADLDPALVAKTREEFPVLADQRL